MRRLRKITSGRAPFGQKEWMLVAIMTRLGNVTALGPTAVTITARLAAWLLVSAGLVVAGTVLLRHGLGFERVWLRDAAIWLHAAGLMLGFLIAAQRRLMIRIDIVHRLMTIPHQRLVDGLAQLLTLILAASLLWFALPYATRSIMLLEGSPDAGGLPGLFLLKSLLPLVLAGIGAIALHQLIASLRSR